jgi:hypothetical protein
VRQSPAGKDVKTGAEDTVKIRYQATASEDTEDIARALVRARGRAL